MSDETMTPTEAADVVEIWLTNPQIDDRRRSAARALIDHARAHHCAPEIVTGDEVDALPFGTRVTTLDSDDRPHPNGGTFEVGSAGLASFYPDVRFLVSRAPKRPLIVNDIIDTAEKLDRLPRGAVIGALDLVAWRSEHQWHCSDEQAPADPRQHLLDVIEHGGAELRLLGLLRSP